MEPARACCDCGLNCRMCRGRHLARRAGGLGDMVGWSPRLALIAKRVVATRPVRKVSEPDEAKAANNGWKHHMRDKGAWHTNRLVKVLLLAL